MTAADSHSAHEPADLTGRLASGTVTFLFTEIEGSTRLWAADTDAMAASLRVHDAILRDSIVSNDGYVFTTAGDSFAAAFSRASDAVTAAKAIQTGLADADWPGPTLRVRIGVHVGEAEERNGDYFGPVVNTAARVEAAAHGGQTLLTDAVRATARAAIVVGASRSVPRSPWPLLPDHGPFRSDQFDGDTVRNGGECRDVGLVTGQHDAVGFRHRDNQRVNGRPGPSTPPQLGRSTGQFDADRFLLQYRLEEPVRVRITARMALERFHEHHRRHYWRPQASSTELLDEGQCPLRSLREATKATAVEQQHQPA